MISIAPASDLSAIGGCSWSKFIFTTRFSLKEIGKMSLRYVYLFHAITV